MTYMSMSYAECLATEIWVYIQMMLAWLKGVAWQPCGALVVGMPTAALPMECGTWCRLTTTQHLCNYSVNWSVQFGFSPWTLHIWAITELGLKIFLKFICYYYWIFRQIRLLIETFSCILGWDTAMQYHVLPLYQCFGFHRSRRPRYFWPKTGSAPTDFFN